MAKYEVLCSINSGEHDRGDILEMSVDSAAALVEVGALRELRGEKPASPKKDAKPKGNGKGSKKKSKKEKEA